jgi:ABC-type transport system involved in multi-copper enzyme maturation permease subunit
MESAITKTQSSAWSRAANRIAAIGRLTATEGLRQPAFFMILAVSAGLTALSPTFAFFHLGEEAKMVTDLGLSTILTFSTLLAVLTASATVADEIEGRTALTMLSKPLRREEFLAGKYLGVAITSCALAIAVAPVLLLTIRSQKYQEEQDPWFVKGVLGAMVLALALFGIFMVVRLLFGRGLTLVRAFWVSYAVFTLAAFGILTLKPGVAVWDFRLLLGILLICFHNCVIAAMAVMLATRCTLVQAALGTAAFFLVGHASGSLVAPFRDSEHHLSFIGSILRAILPDLDQFNITDALATAYLDQPVRIPWDIVAGSSLYAALYVGALLAIGIALFSRRELG